MLFLVVSSIIKYSLMSPNASTVVQQPAQMQKDIQCDTFRTIASNFHVWAVIPVNKDSEYEYAAD